MDRLDRHVLDDRHQSVARERDDGRDVDGLPVLRDALGYLYDDHAHMWHRVEVPHVAPVAGALQASEREDRAARVVGREAAGHDQDPGREDSPLDALRRSRSLQRYLQESPVDMVRLPHAARYREHTHFSGEEAADSQRFRRSADSASVDLVRDLSLHGRRGTTLNPLYDTNGSRFLSSMIKFHSSVPTN